MVVNTLRNLFYAGAARTPAAHNIIPKGVIYVKCTKKRRLYSVQKSKGRMSEDKMLLFCVEIIVVALSVVALG